MKVAICYYGVVRACCNRIYKSHHDNIFNILKIYNISYDIFLHSWNKGSYINKIQNYENQLKSEPNDYKLYTPNYYQLDDQDEFIQQNINNTIFWPLGIENTFSLGRNAVFAMESQKRVINLMTNTNNTYDIVILLRPDLIIMSPINLSLFNEIKEKEIMIGYNNNNYDDIISLSHISVIKLYSHRLYDIERAKEYSSVMKSLLPEGYLTEYLNYHEKNNNIIINKKLQNNWLFRFGVVRDWDIITENPWNIQWLSPPNNKILYL